MTRRRPRIPRPAKLAVFLAIIGLCAYLLYLRYIDRYFFTVIPGKVYRCAQPRPDDLIQRGYRYRLNSVIDLRRLGHAGHTEQAQAARIAALTLTTAPLPPGRMPPRPALARLIQAIESAPQPLLIHGRFGLERTALASVIAAMALGHLPYEQARRECSWRRLQFWPPRHGPVGVLIAYEQYCRQHHLKTGLWHQFRKWATEVYFPEYFGCVIDLPPRTLAAAGATVKLRVSVTNRSSIPLPADDLNKDIVLVGFTTASPPDSDEPILSTTRLPARRLEPGQSLSFDIVVKAPLETGEHRLRFDLLERGVTWFSAQGSPLAQTTFIVQPRQESNTTDTDIPSEQ